MINAEAGGILLEYSKHIARWAKQAEQGGGDTPRAKRARNSAWRVLSVLVKFAEHLKESDMYWMLLDNAEASGKSAREQHRLRSIAKAEDRGYMSMKAQLEDLVSELVATEKANPKAVEPAAKLSVQALKSKPAAKKAAAVTSAKKKAAPAPRAPAKKAARPAAREKAS